MTILRKALHLSQLRKGHAEFHFSTVPFMGVRSQAKMMNPTLRVVALNQLEESLAIHQIEYLGEDIVTRVHGRRPS